MKPNTTFPKHNEIQARFERVDFINRLIAKNASFSDLDVVKSTGAQVRFGKVVFGFMKRQPKTLWKTF